jgi:hypothetical protein
MKKNNPNIPIMLREAAGTLPQVYARYGTSETRSKHRLMFTATHVPPLLQDRNSGDGMGDPNDGIDLYICVDDKS